MTYTVELERMAYGTDAVGHLSDGKTVFVSGGAPKDTVEIEIVEEEKAFARARIERLIEPSPDRVAPVSPEDFACGTAPWQHLSYDAQLRAKRLNVVSALVHTARFDPQRAEELVAECVPSKRTWGYRNKLELGCGRDEGGKFIVGFYREGTGELVETQRSRLAHKQIERAPKALCGALRYLQGSDDLGIFRIGVRHSLATGDLEVALWTRPSGFPRALVAKTIASACKATGIIRVLADPGAARKIKGVEVLGGRGRWRERIGTAEFATQAPSFFQVNTAQAAKLVDLVVDGLTRALGADGLDGAYIADLYAGGGTFSIPLALAGADVDAIEAAASSVRDLRHNADANGVDIEVIGGDAARELDALDTPDALVVDPPRSGLAKGVVEDIARLHPSHVAYVSCDTATWARDIARFERNGYRLLTATPVDMFPQTYHVETVSLLSEIGGGSQR